MSNVCWVTTLVLFVDIIIDIAFVNLVPHVAVLCGQLLCFFKDEEDFYDQKAASSPISIHQAKIEVAGDYTKKKHVFR